MTKRNLGSFALIAMLFALCSSVDAQQPKKVVRIGYISSGNPSTESVRSEPIRIALRELGYKDKTSPSRTDMRRGSWIGSLSLRPS